MMWLYISYYDVTIIQLKWTPLHYAANHDRSDTVALLVNSGADISMKNVVSLWWIITFDLLRSIIVVYKLLWCKFE